VCLALGVGLVGVECERCSDVAGVVGVGEDLSDLVGGFPACAVPWNDDVWGEIYKSLDRGGEDRFE